MTRDEYRALRARFRGESAAPAVLCQACGAPDYACSCADLYALGLTPIPAHEGADVANPRISPTVFDADSHASQHATRRFLGPHAFTTLLHPTLEQDVTL